MNVVKVIISAILLITVLSIHAQPKYAMVIHGGAGVMSEDKMSSELRAAYEAKLN